MRVLLITGVYLVIAASCTVSASARIDGCYDDVDGNCVHYISYNEEVGNQIIFSRGHSLIVPEKCPNRDLQLCYVGESMAIAIPRKMALNETVTTESVTVSVEQLLPSLDIGSISCGMVYVIRVDNLRAIVRNPNGSVWQRLFWSPREGLVGISRWTDPESVSIRRDACKK